MEKLFELHDGDNIGGIARIAIARMDDFASFAPVVFHAGKNWKEIPILPESSLLKSDEPSGDQGTYYVYAGTFKIHHLTALKEIVMRRYVGPVSVMRIVDLNGRVYVIGSPAEPVTISRQGNTGTRPTDMNHDQFSFSVSQLRPALF